MEVQRPRLFHISEEPGIEVFEPRPSPAQLEGIRGDLVFAISENLLHNYLLPRDCPRVTFYSKHDTTDRDREKYFGVSTSDFVVAVESGWYPVIRQTTLYCYEFPGETFEPLDEGAGYYVSYQRVAPLSVRQIDDCLKEVRDRNVELRVMPSLLELADRVSKSTLEFSLIRMRNATGQGGRK